MTRSERLNEMAKKMYELADGVERQAADLRQEGEAETPIGRMKIEHLEERAHHMRLRASDIKVEAVIAEGMTELIRVVSEIRDSLTKKRQL